MTEIPVFSENDPYIKCSFLMIFTRPSDYIFEKVF